MKVKTLIRQLLDCRRRILKYYNSDLFSKHWTDKYLNVEVKDTNGNIRHIKSVKLKHSGYYTAIPTIEITLTSK